MDSKKYFLIFVLVLALIITVFIGTLCRNNEGFINTKTCVSLSTDQTIKAYEMCNNLMAGDPSGCQVMIEELACPIKGVAMNAMLTKADAAFASKPTALSTYAPFE